jgi:ribonuclease-3
MYEKLFKLFQDTDIQIKDDNVVQAAFIHRSFLNESRDKTLQSNERLEFLGDSVLSLVVSDYLYKTYTELPEGQLTNYRSSIVKTGSLAEAAKELGLGEYLQMAKGEAESGGKENPSLLADTYEALLGVIYLNCGFEKAQTFVSNTLLGRLAGIISTGAYRDFKSLFQEMIQEKYRVSPVYAVVATSGPDHAKEFEVEVQVQNIIYAKGKGRSKQEAEQAAAKGALDSIAQS